MIIKRLQPARYLAGLVFCWGMVATFSAFVNNFAALVACRLLLGVFEAGLFPGVILYLSMCMRSALTCIKIMLTYHSLQQTQSCLASGVLLRNQCHFWRTGWSGSICYWRVRWSCWVVWMAMDVSHDYQNPHSHLKSLADTVCSILINGIPTILTAVVTPFVLPNSPETAKFLTEEDRRNLVTLRMSEIGQTKSGQQMNKKDVMDGVRDWKTYAYAISQFVGLGMLYSFSVFLPTIIDGMGGGWSRQVVQALTIPVYFAGFASYIVCAWYGDKIQQKGIFCIGGLAVSMLGYIFLIINKGLVLSYCGTFIVALGLWVSTGAAFTWINNNNPRYGKRAFASGMQITIGNISGVVSPFLYSSNTAPEYLPGYGATIGLLAVGIMLYTALHFYFRMQNKKKREGKFDYLMEGKTEEEIAEMGENNPRYMYTI